MDVNTLLLGKILAEVYKLKRAAGGCSVDDATIYGLSKGIEVAVEQEIREIGFVSRASFDHVVSVLEPIYYGPNGEVDSEFRGFYDIEPKLNAGGVDRSTAIRVLKYLYANGQFKELIDKMDSTDSPVEAKKFNIEDDLS